MLKTIKEKTKSDQRYRWKANKSLELNGKRCVKEERSLGDCPVIATNKH